MPSFEHELLVGLFRRNPHIALELLRGCAVLPTAWDHLLVSEANLTRLVPTVFLADLVILFRDRARRPVFGLIVEVQRYIDRDKLLSWPSYVANLRSEQQCPTMLLVVAPDPVVAAWARQSIELGHPEFQLTPIVLGPDEIPHVRDPTAASDLPELSMLSALTHRDLHLAKIALHAIQHVPNDQRRVYLQAIQQTFAGDDIEDLGGSDERS